MYNRAILCLEPLFTRGALEEAEDYTRSRPTLAYSLEETVDMENVAAFCLYAGCLAKSLDHADRAVLVPIHPIRRLRVLLNAGWIKAGEASSLVLKTTAYMAAGMNFVARFSHQIHADRAPADLFESGYH
jgi:hypothetical protein